MRFARCPRAAIAALLLSTACQWSDKAPAPITDRADASRPRLDADLSQADVDQGRADAPDADPATCPRDTILCDQRCVPCPSAADGADEFTCERDRCVPTSCPEKRSACGARCCVALPSAEIFDSAAWSRAQYASAAASADGLIHLFFRDASEARARRELRHALWDGEGWSLRTIPHTEGNDGIYWSAAAVDPSGRPAVLLLRQASLEKGLAVSAYLLRALDERGDAWTDARIEWSEAGLARLRPPALTFDKGGGAHLTVIEEGSERPLYGYVAPDPGGPPPTSLDRVFALTDEAIAYTAALGFREPSTLYASYTVPIGDPIHFEQRVARFDLSLEAASALQDVEVAFTIPNPDGERSATRSALIARPDGELRLASGHNVTYAARPAGGGAWPEIALALAPESNAYRHLYLFEEGAEMIAVYRDRRLPRAFGGDAILTRVRAGVAEPPIVLAENVGRTAFALARGPQGIIHFFVRRRTDPDDSASDLFEYRPLRFDALPP